MSTAEGPSEDLPAERRQREWELSQALESARTLQARLELLGDRARDVAIVRSLRDSLARDLAALARGDRVDAEAVLHEQESGDYLIGDGLPNSAFRSDEVDPS